MPADPTEVDALAPLPQASATESHGPVRREGQSAAEWQAELFDALIREDPVEAFGRGPIQQALWEKRVALTSRYAAHDAPTLDVGCGNGLVTRMVAERVGGPVVGMDVSEECVRHAAAHNAHPRVQYRHGSVEDFEPSEPLGLIVMYEVLEHLDDPAETLRRLVGWLRPGGHLILSTPNRSSLNRRIKAAPGLNRLYRRLGHAQADAVSPGHVEEYHYRDLRAMIEGAGLTVAAEFGAVLVMPFPDMIGPLARSRRFARLNVRSGDWCPRLAGAVYFVARKDA